jgi:tellurite resistance protein
MLIFADVARIDMLFISRSPLLFRFSHLPMATVQSSYSNQQLTAWLRGLLTIAWADGHCDPEEQEVINRLTPELTRLDDSTPFVPITAAELATLLGQDPDIAENFLRTAVMVAIADGVYTHPESDVLHQFSTALACHPAILNNLRQTLYPPIADSDPTAALASPRQPPSHYPLPSLDPVKDWLDGMAIHDPKLAHILCKLIPAQCPFERDVNLFGRKILHIPPLCKINPLYEQLVGLRFRALSYLADDCGEDVAPYC